MSERVKYAFYDSSKWKAGADWGQKVALIFYMCDQQHNTCQDLLIVEIILSI